jgi:hypothetical protein
MVFGLAQFGMAVRENVYVDLMAFVPQAAPIIPNEIIPIRVDVRFPVDTEHSSKEMLERISANKNRDALLRRSTKGRLKRGFTKFDTAKYCHMGWTTLFLSSPARNFIANGQ